jgi:hypothetical protein
MTSNKRDDKLTNEEYETMVVKLLDDAWKTYDDAAHRLTLDLDIKQRQEWQLLMKEQLEIIDSILKMLPTNTIQLYTEKEVSQ